VNVRRLVVFPAVKMKPVRADAEHRWHGANEGWRETNQPAVEQRFKSERTSDTIPRPPMDCPSHVSGSRWKSQTGSRNREYSALIFRGVSDHGRTGSGRSPFAKAEEVAERDVGISRRLAAIAKRPAWARTPAARRRGDIRPAEQ
jgi:hypothetical protein